MYPDICICICICICVRIRLEFPSFYADAVHTSLGINLYLFREHNNPKVKNQKQQRATGIHESKKKNTKTKESGDVCTSQCLCVCLFIGNNDYAAQKTWTNNEPRTLNDDGDPA